MNTKCTNHNRLADRSSNHTYTKKELVGIKVPKSEHHKIQGNKIGFCCFLLPILPSLHYNRLRILKGKLLKKVQSHTIIRMSEEQNL